MKVEVKNGEISDIEMDYYIKLAGKKYSLSDLEKLLITVVDDNYVDMEYHIKPVPFQRIRRVTGYLAGTLDKFNDAKRAEEKDRVKHDV